MRTTEIKSRTLLWFASTLLVVGCTAGGGSDGESQTALSDQEVHQRVQDAIQECMQSQGFEYQQAAFVDVDRGTPLGSLRRISLADEFGYGVAFNALVTFAPLGQPITEGESPSREFIEAYDQALLGPDDFEVRSEAGGCTREGFTVRQQLSGTTVEVSEEFEDDTDALFVLSATPAFSDYEAEWSRCMGADRLADGPLAHQQAATFELFDSSIEVVGQIYSDENDEGLLHMLERTALVDLGSLNQLSTENQSFADLVDFEVQLATKDSDCRATAYSLIEEDVEALQVEN